VQTRPRRLGEVWPSILPSPALIVGALKSVLRGNFVQWRRNFPQRDVQPLTAPSVWRSARRNIHPA
jgi:hypothetical protein